MNMPTPTSEAAAAAALPGSLAPPGLPDVAGLTQLASAFFAMLPGETMAAALPGLAQRAPSLTAAPVAAQPPASLPGPVPLPTSLPVGHPAPPPAAVPPVTVTATGAGVGPVSSAPVAASAAPFYFLDEAGAGLRAAGGRDGLDDLDGLAAAASAPAVLPAQSFGLPGESELQALLRSLTAPGPTHADGPYYFVDAPASVPALAPLAAPAFDVQAVRRDFPILAERVANGRPLVWFDNAATTQKPQAVIDRLAYFYAHENSNIHRAAHELAARATEAYEQARRTVAGFLGAGSPDEIVFVRGATEAINLVAQSWGRQEIGEGDEIIVSLLEHHANIVPWQRLAAEKGAKLRVIPVDDDGQIRLDEYARLLNARTKLVAVTQVSNALGTIVPVADVVRLGHAAGARVLIDGAQAVSHLRVDVQALDADFYVFSGHKIFGPTGIGVLYGKPELLAAMPPWQGGGNMIADVSFEQIRYQDAPARFEAGTGNIADAVGLGAALDYVQRLGLERIAQYEHELLVHASAGLRTVPGLRLIGTAPDKASVVSFVLAGYRSDEVGTALNREGIAVRSGHHCAQPILRRFGLETSVRPSLAFYNTREEVDRMIRVLQQLARERRV